MGDILNYINEDGTEVYKLEQDGTQTLTGDSAQTGVSYGTVTTVAMGDGAWALVHGTAGASETQLTGNTVFCDPESGGASEILTLPPEATSAGLVLDIFNTGGEGIVVKDDAAGTVATLATAEHCRCACDGTTWYGFVGPET